MPVHVHVHMHMYMCMYMYMYMYIYMYGYHDSLLLHGLVDGGRNLLQREVCLSLEVGLEVVAV